MTAAFDFHTTADQVLAGLRLEGRAILVTGANAGIGYETALALARHGATIYLGCRNGGAAAAAASRIRGEAPGANLHPVDLDLSSLRRIHEAASTLPDRLHAVICNAGVYGAYAETADGFERTVGVCHLGHFLLVNLLRDRLRAAAPSRVVFVSSENHRYPRRLDFSRFPLNRHNYHPLVAYGQAKLCNVLTANEWTRRLGTDGVFANSLHPGTLVHTGIGRDSALARTVLNVARPFTKSLSQAAATSVYCAAHPDLQRVGGAYFVNCRQRTPSKAARDVDTARFLWEVSERWVGLC